MKLIRLFLNKNKLKTYAVLASNIMVFALAFAFNILMTHYCRVEVYGKYRYATQFVQTVPALFTLGIDQSCGRLIASRKTKNNSGLIGVSLVTIFGVSLIISGGLYSATIIPSVKAFEAGSVYAVIPFVPVFMLQAVINMVYQGKGEAYKLAVFDVLPRVLLIIVGGLFILTRSSLSFSEAIYIYLFSNAVVIFPRIVGTKFSFLGMKNAFSELRTENHESGFKVYLSSIFQRSSTQIVGLICGGLFGFTEYGYYALALSMAGTFRFISSSMAVATYSENVNRKKIEKNDLFFLILSNTILLVIFFLLIDTVFFWFFPHRYSIAVIYLKILGTGYVLFGISDYFTKFLIARRQGKVVMINALITGVSFILFSMLLVFLTGIMGLVIATLLSAIVDMIQSIARYLQLTRVEQGDIKNDIQFDTQN